MKFELVNKAGNLLMKKTGKFGLKVQEKAPEILLVTGVVGVVGTVILACRATLKVDEVIDRHKEDMNKVHEWEERDDEYKEESPEDKFKIFCHTGLDLAKLYSPAVGLGVFSITCIMTSNGIMKKRYTEAVMAYTTVSTAFNEYRARVREDGGEDLDRKYRFGTREETRTKEEIDEEGKKKKVKETVEVVNDKPSGYARYFDSSNPNWDRNTNFSLMFLRAQQEILNNLLQTRGHVFLNEVYDALGFRHTQDGALVGWRIGKDAGDEYIDFGLYDAQKEGVRRFVNGEDNVILLDFNVDGPIFNKIPR